MAQRREQRAPAKREWQYIQFMQQAKERYPHASKDELVDAWKKLRAEKAMLVERLIVECLQSAAYS